MIARGANFQAPPGIGSGPIGEAQLALLLVVLLTVVMVEASEEADFTFTSWYRDPMRNAMVGGVPNSRHLLGLGLDVAVNPSRAQTVLTLGLAAGRVRTGLLLAFRRIKEQLGLGAAWQVVDEGDHVHFELDF